MKLCLKVVNKKSQCICIHDAVRPFIKKELIEKIISSLNDCDAVVVGSKATDTLKEVSNNQIKSIVYSSFSISGIVKKFNQEEAKEAMRNGYIVILVGGTGNPYFTTDTTAVLRALELDCDVLLKGTKVDGIYDKDPEKFSKVKKFTKLDYNYVINNKLKVMDMTSIIMAEEANLPIIIFSIKKKNELKKVIDKETEYTIISN